MDLILILHLEIQRIESLVKERGRRVTEKINVVVTYTHTRNYKDSQTEFRKSSTGILLHTIRSLHFT